MAVILFGWVRIFVFIICLPADYPINRACHLLKLDIISSRTTWKVAFWLKENFLKCKYSLRFFFFKHFQSKDRHEKFLLTSYLRLNFSTTNLALEQQLGVKKSSFLPNIFLPGGTRGVPQPGGIYYHSSVFCTRLMRCLKWHIQEASWSEPQAILTGSFELLTLWQRKIPGIQQRKLMFFIFECFYWSKATAY